MSLRFPHPLKKDGSYFFLIQGIRNTSYFLLDRNFFFQRHCALLLQLEKVSFLFQGTLNQHFLWVLKSQGTCSTWWFVLVFSLHPPPKKKYLYFLTFWEAPQKTINKLLTVDPPRESFHIYLPIYTIQGTFLYHRNSR